MNKKQTEKLVDAKSDIDKVRNNVTLILTALQEIFNELEAEFDGLSETKQEGDEGQKLEAEKTAIQEAIDTLQEIDSNIDDFEGSINTAME